ATGRWLVKLAIQAAMGVAIQEQFDVVTQLVSIKVLHIQNKWNLEETGMQALVGLLGAGMGFGLMPLEHMMTEGLADFLSKLLSLDKTNSPAGDDLKILTSDEKLPEPVPHDESAPEPESDQGSRPVGVDGLPE